MKQCPNCKNMLEDDEMFCHECGAKQNIEEEAVQEEQPAQEGAKCIHCGEIIEKDSAFCPYCGKSQQQEETVEEEKAEIGQEQPVTEQPEQEQPTSNQQQEIAYEADEEKKSKAWIWILLAVLLAGAGVWYFFYNQGNEPIVAEEEGMIEEIGDSIYSDEKEMVEEEVTGYHSFLEQFYKKYGDETYLLSHITANVKNKLKRDYDYDCPSGDCLAAWVFTAYPAGADLETEEGPIISETDEEGKFRVDFKYSGYNGEQKEYETRTVFLTVAEIDGKYVISDYELMETDESNGESQLPEEDESVNDMPVSGDESQRVRSAENAQTISSDDMQQSSSFFVFGSVDELKQFGVIDDGGRLRQNFNKNYFTKIDPSIDKTIKLYSKYARILTPHPSSSYTLTTDEHKQYVLSVTDHQAFWTSSRYLVILVK